MRPFPVVETRASQLLVVKPESQRFDQVKLKPGIGREAHDVTGVGGYLRLEKNNVHHDVTYFAS
jgi:hypothetical protein